MKWIRKILGYRYVTKKYQGVLFGESYVYCYITADLDTKEHLFNPDTFFDSCAIQWNLKPVNTTYTKELYNTGTIRHHVIK